ncbi:MAG: hypothetical protein JNM50_09470 [Chromatiales bacterium]|nr:hypothetical protein [Chromatiales bacterium]
MAAVAQQADFDIVGLKLGMTQDQVVAAIKAHDPGLKVVSVQSAFGYSDGTQQLQTPPFLSRIEARAAGGPSGKPALAVYFTPPPQAGRVWAIERNEKTTGEPPTVQQYVAALQQKYGEPTAVSPGYAALAWDFPSGRVNCIPRLPDRPGFPAFRPSGSDDLGFMLNLWQQRKLAPADLSRCASRLHYVLGSSIVTDFSAILIDVATFASANAAAMREVDDLEQNARRQRDDRGQVPKL